MPLFNLPIIDSKRAQLANNKVEIKLDLWKINLFLPLLEGIDKQHVEIKYVEDHDLLLIDIHKYFNK